MDVSQRAGGVIWLAVGQHSALARRRTLDFADLVEESWVLPPPDAPGASAVMAAFRARGLPAPRTAMSTFSVRLRNYLGMSGQFIIAVPASVLQLNADIYSLKKLPIDLQMQPWPVAIVALKNRTLSPTARLFIDCARDVAESIGVHPRAKKISSR